MSNIKLDVESFYERVKELTYNKGCELEDLYSAIGTPSQNLKNKKTRGVFPKLEELFRMADFLGTTVDYLVTGRVTNPYQQKCIELESRLNKITELSSQ